MKRWQQSSPGNFYRIALLACLLQSGCKIVPQVPPAIEQRVSLAHIPAQFQANAQRWNAVFQKQPGSALGWSGGDAVLSVELPFCAACLPHEKLRRFWSFGDSTFSAVDEAGYRIVDNGTRGTHYTFGNVVALTSASSVDDATQRVLFDYGASGIQSNAWMPLLIEPQSLPDMSDLRIAARGYQSLGFSRSSAVVAQVYSQKSLVPQAFREDAAPVYEFFNPTLHASDYRLSAEELNDGFVQERIAFYVLRHPQPGTVALHRQIDRARLAVTLDVSVQASQAAAEQGDDVLGYVYAGNAQQQNTHPLIAYRRNNPLSGLLQHVYTTRPNDTGKPVLMWPNRPFVIGNDLLQVYSPVTPLVLSGMVSWDEVEENIVAIVRDVNRPYTAWGKQLHGDWVSRPQQVMLPFTSAQTMWGHLVVRDKDYADNGLIYVYALRDGDLLVARLACRSADDFLDFARWQFFSDGRWQADAEAATAVASGVGAGFNVVRSSSGQYFLIHSSRTLAPEIRVQVASSPQGVFEKYKTLDLRTYENERERADRYAYYAISVHDNLSYGGDESGLMISYIRSCAFSVAPACQGKNSDDGRADVYVPRFINLPWSLLEEPKFLGW